MVQINKKNFMKYSKSDGTLNDTHHVRILDGTDGFQKFSNVNLSLRVYVHKDKELLNIDSMITDENTQKNINLCKQRLKIINSQLKIIYANIASYVLLAPL